jgi:hypothetical protein
MAISDPLDAKYYQVAAPRSLGERLLILARDRIYAEFIRHCRPGPDETIVDVGVSDVISDGANVLERKYPHPGRITAAGLGSAAEFRTAFPQIDYVHIEANQRLPFADKAFDIATSNAVLEHVGSRDNQRLLVAEFMRVARRVFLTVPNRYFPVEHHTAIPLLHFSDRGFALACRYLRKDEWAEERNLILMSMGHLISLFPAGAIAGHTGLPLGPFSSNLFVFFDDRCATQ